MSGWNSPHSHLQISPLNMRATKVSKVALVFTAIFKYDCRHTLWELQQKQWHAVFLSSPIYKRLHAANVPLLCAQLSVEGGLVKDQIFPHTLGCHFPLLTYVSKTNALNLFAPEVAVTYLFFARNPVEVEYALFSWHNVWKGLTCIVYLVSQIILKWGFSHTEVIKKEKKITKDLLFPGKYIQTILEDFCRPVWFNWSSCKTMKLSYTDSTR